MAHLATSGSRAMRLPLVPHSNFDTGTSPPIRIITVKVSHLVSRYILMPFLTSLLLPLLLPRNIITPGASISRTIRMLHLCGCDFGLRSLNILNIRHRVHPNMRRSRAESPKRLICSPLEAMSE